MSRRTCVFLLLGGLWLSGAPSAAAQSGPSEAPPGNSAVDQYRESLPPSSGERRSLSRKDREALRKQGPDGQALAAVLERSGGVPRSAAASSDGGAASESRSDGPGRESRRPSTAEDEGNDRRTDGATTGAQDPPSESENRQAAAAAASSTVGPVPVWAMLVGAVALVGVGLVVRTRLTP